MNKPERNLVSFNDSELLLLDVCLQTYAITLRDNPQPSVVLNAAFIKFYNKMRPRLNGLADKVIKEMEVL